MVRESGRAWQRERLLEETRVHAARLRNMDRCGTRTGRGNRLPTNLRMEASFGLPSLVLLQPAFEQGDGGAEVIVQGDKQVDVVEVLVAVEAVGEVVGGLTVARISPQRGQRKRK